MFKKTQNPIPLPSFGDSLTGTEFLNWFDDTVEAATGTPSWMKPEEGKEAATQHQLGASMAFFDKQAALRMEADKELLKGMLNANFGQASKDEMHYRIASEIYEINPELFKYFKPWIQQRMVYEKKIQI